MRMREDRLGEVRRNKRNNEGNRWLVKVVEG